MDSGEFSHTNLDAKLVVPMVQEQIRIARDQYHAERRAYITHEYYRPYVRWTNFFNAIRRFFGMKPKMIVDSDTYYREFNDSDLSLTQSLALVMVGCEQYIRIDNLKEILPLAEAAMQHDGIVKLTPKHCRLLGYGRNLIPITQEEQERRIAEKELEVSINS